MSTISPILGEHCKSCSPFLLSIESCPRIHIFEGGEISLIFLEIFWVFVSFLPVFAFFALLFQIFIRKTSRAILIFFNLLFGQIVNALLKRYFAQARPNGACSTSFGYPSGHSTFASGIATWLFLEILVFHQNVPFKASKFYSTLRNGSIIVAPFIPTSRYFLNYHSIEQILYGLVNGVVCTMFYFGVVMGTFLYKKNGKFYGSVLAKVYQKFRLIDNMVHYNFKKEGQEEESPKISKEEFHDIIHPIRDSLRKVLETRFNRLEIQEKLK